MVLRGADRAAGVLKFHTDARSGKVEQLGTQPRVAWLFYDPESKLQVRTEGSARVIREAQGATLAWQGLSELSKRTYCGPQAPGSMAEAPTSGLPVELESRTPTESEWAEAACRFAVVECRTEVLEILQLSFSGHTRARFRLGPAGWEGEWLVP